MVRLKWPQFSWAWAGPILIGLQDGPGRFLLGSIMGPKGHWFSLFFFFFFLW